MTQQIGAYEYTYGAGNTPNRKIDFYEDGQKIWGDVFRKIRNSWENIGSITESQMTKEGASTTRKIEIMMAAREAFKPPQYPPDISFDKMPCSERVEVIKNLQPKGKYRISIINNIGLNPFYEKVESLTFFDPS